MRLWNTLPLSILLLISLGCASAVPSTGSSGEMQRAAQGPGSHFFSVDDAVFDAMLHAHTKHFPGIRPDLVAGTIQRVDGGFTYGEPTASDPQRRAARFALREGDVASYLVYTRLHDRRLDRRNEKVSKRMMRVVDEIDPLHRPLYVLTPSLAVLTYDGSEPRAIARLGAPRPTKVAVGSP